MHFTVFVTLGRNAKSENAVDGYRKSIAVSGGLPAQRHGLS